MTPVNQEKFIPVRIFMMLRLWLDRPLNKKVQNVSLK